MSGSTRRRSGAAPPPCRPQLVRQLNLLEGLVDDAGLFAIGPQKRALVLVEDSKAHVSSMDRWTEV